MNRQEIKNILRGRTDQFSIDALKFINQLEAEILNLENAILQNEGVSIQYYDGGLELISEILQSSD